MQAVFDSYPKQQALLRWPISPPHRRFVSLHPSQNHPTIAERKPGDEKAVSEIVQERRTHLAGEPFLLHPYQLLEPRDNVRFSEPIGEVRGEPRLGLGKNPEPTREQIYQRGRGYRRQEWNTTPPEAVRHFSTINVENFRKQTVPRLDLLDRLKP